MDATVHDAFDTSLETPPHAGGPVLHAGAPPEEAKIAMILLHGRGAGPEDVLSLADAYALEGVCYLAPAAGDLQIEKRSWYPHPFTMDFDKNEPFIESAFSVIESLLSHLAKRGLPPERCVLGGFSQGACLATHFAYRYPRRYGMIVGYSGGLIGNHKQVFQPHGDLEGTPVELSGGEKDVRVPWARVEQTARVLRAMHAQVEIESYPDLPHTICREQVQKTRERLQALLAGLRK
ncbi:MAG: dienelactone hydrolase family protein [Phycisphaerales bacterium]